MIKIIIRKYYETEEKGKIYKFYHDMPVIIGKKIKRYNKDTGARQWIKDENSPTLKFREVKKKEKNEPYLLIGGECPICGEKVTHGYATGPRESHCSSKCSDYYIYEKSAEPSDRNPYPFYDDLIKLSLETKKNVVVEGKDIKDMPLGVKYIRIEVLYDESKALEILEGYKKIGSK
ncbi:hypothetical protein [Methanobacterium oryzae]|uniref:hypothetical protein n=1 Tax=Methanobacterium oryzae TaxID=69540 RepID=UPI003D1B78A0